VHHSLPDWLTDTVLTQLTHTNIARGQDTSMLHRKCDTAECQQVHCCSVAIFVCDKLYCRYGQSLYCHLVYVPDMDSLCTASSFMFQIWTVSVLSPLLWSRYGQSLYCHLFYVPDVDSLCIVTSFMFQIWTVSVLSPLLCSRYGQSLYCHLFYVPDMDSLCIVISFITRHSLVKLTYVRKQKIYCDSKIVPSGQNIVKSRVTRDKRWG
jgi:hypothetical protein